MNVYIFKQVSPSLKGPLQLYALHDDIVRLATFCTREVLLSEAGFEKVFRTQNWVRRRKLFCR